MEATGWLFEMMSLLGVVVSNFMEFSSYFTRFLCDFCLQKKVLFLSHFIKEYDVMMTSPLYYDKIK